MVASTPGEAEENEFFFSKHILDALKLLPRPACATTSWAMGSPTGLIGPVGWRGRGARAMLRSGPTAAAAIA